jgi:hypothetical protein
MWSGVAADAAERFFECGRVSAPDMGISTLAHMVGNPPPGMEPSTGQELPETSLHSLGSCDHDPDGERRPRPSLYPDGDIDPYDLGPAVEIANGQGFPVVVFHDFPDFGGGGDGSGGDDDDFISLFRELTANPRPEP